MTTESIKSSKRKIWKHCGVKIFSLITDVSISISTKCCAFCTMSYFANLKIYGNGEISCFHTRNIQFSLLILLSLEISKIFHLKKVFQEKL